VSRFLPPVGSLKVFNRFLRGFSKSNKSMINCNKMLERHLLGLLEYSSTYLVEFSC